jgi:hypothetical protein
MSKMWRAHAQIQALIPAAVLASVLLAGPIAAAAPRAESGTVTRKQDTQSRKEDRKEDTVRPDLAKSLTAAERAITVGQFDEALSDLAATDRVTKHTPYEDSVINRLRLIAAVKAEQTDLATQAYQTMEANGNLPTDDKSSFSLGIAALYFKQQNYAHAIEWATRYAATGGADPSARIILEQSAYLSGDYANTVTLVLDDVSAGAQRGTAPDQATLQMLLDAAKRQNNQDAVAVALESLVTHFPKPEYWAQLLAAAQARPGFAAARLELDVDRLKIALGLLSTPDQYEDYVDTAVIAGFTGEAKATIEDGFAHGTLGSGDQAARQARLRAFIDRQADAGRQALAATETAAQGTKTGDALVDAGIAYLGFGQTDKAISLIEAGIARGGLKWPDDANLRLGEAWFREGQPDRAIAAWRRVKDGGGAVALAHLWILRAGSHA